ncbi:YNS9 [Hepatospora eriocheir]|uniref:YNS9 n=1 Tax=Hepatospora eriocheir TaxID=1081669 RepID=A0A1X0Q8J2_9MICR|nr:YNS9 [Hepatospora eriocheir]
MPISLRKNFIINCYECHSLIKFCVQNIQLINKQKVAIKQGTELPNKGACDHYSKSLRWFRFPCCNHLFPCDICHNKQMKHKADLATNMVCGLCSKEQSVKKECPCGMNMIAKTSRFWEGGKGNRNKQTLSKKDSRKYK